MIDGKVSLMKVTDAKLWEENVVCGENVCLVRHAIKSKATCGRKNELGLKLLKIVLIYLLGE